MKYNNMSVKESRSKSFVVIALVYVVAIIVGVLAFRLLSGTGWHHLWLLFAADMAGTVVAWFFGLIFRNVSVYDPYWSVAPPVMLTLWAWHTGHWTSATMLLLVAVWYWGIRLTGNWAYTFRNLNSEDWRYAKYRTSQSQFVFQIINFFGFNMMPTVIVFLAMVPGFLLIDADVQASSFVWLGFLMCVVAATLQLVADTQRHRFARECKGQVCTVGLWRHGRHPNYFGEMLMWWGVWVMCLSISNAARPEIWFIGPLLNTALFCFVSVPLMEKRQLQNKPWYAEYRENTRMFI